MFIRGPSTTELKGFIAKISIVFALKDLEIVSYFLKIEVLYDTYHKRKYFKYLLAKVKMLNCKGIDTLMSTGLKL